MVHCLHMNILNEFEAELEKRIQAWIHTARKQGDVGASVECLIQCVPNPPSHLKGAPNGTNARFYYHRMFREICERPSIVNFIIK